MLTILSLVALLKFPTAEEHHFMQEYFFLILRELSSDLLMYISQLVSSESTPQ